jgi:hypothetical protein
MKTYVIMISKTFPAYHNMKGSDTHFVAQIELKVKLHTLRRNYKLWEKRIKEVMNGKAILSVRTWTGKPYASKQKVEYEFAAGEVAIEELVWQGDHFQMMNGKKMPIPMEVIARNDGLNLSTFQEWFKKVPIGESLACIHFRDWTYISTLK